MKNKLSKLKYLLIPIFCFLLLKECTFPDSKNANTYGNKMWFDLHFDFYPTEDVKNIYSYMTVYRDGSFQLSFDCNQDTINKIVENLGLNPSSKRRSHISKDFHWWNNNDIGKIKTVYFNENKNSDYFKILWFDAENKKAYYLEYSM